MKTHDPIYVAGHRGMVGSALVRRLHARGYENILMRTRQELDLTNAAAVEAFFSAERPHYVFLAAAKVGGIAANHDFPADFIRENLQIELNVIDAARRHGCQKLLYLGSSCVYPKHAPQPIREDDLLTGPLEPTNQPYAIAKIAGLEMCNAYRRQYGRKYISVMPTNLYGPNDNFDPATSHVLAALMRRFHEAKEQSAPEVVVWGTGKPLREFLHADDLADACVYLMEKHEDIALVNVGWGKDISIADLAALIARVVGFTGAVRFDTEKPDGTPRKLLDTRLLSSLGWQPSITLKNGLRSTYEWYCSRAAAVSA